jgi:Ni/Co efflux regulator RcnB
MCHGKPQLRMLSAALALALCVSGGFSTSAYADKGGNGQGYSHRNDNEDSNRRRENDNGRLDNERGGHDHSRVAFDDNDRNAIRGYMKTHHHGHCPPGLAKKHNGCLPPGHAKRYEIGQRLPSRVTYTLAPYSLRRHLRPPHPGYQYVQVDDDVVLMSKQDKTIVDAVSLLSDLAQ